MRRIGWATAPLCLFVYGVCYLLDGRQGFHGPGLFWTLGHVFFVLAFLSFAGLAWRLKNPAGPDMRGRLALAAAIIALAGIAVFVRVGLIDLATGLLASDHAAMAPISARLNAWPDARLLPVFQLGPILFQAGLMALLVLRVIRRGLPWWSPVAVLGGFLLIAVNLNFLVLGAVAIGIGLMKLPDASASAR
jgi:hypothetical protein